MRERKRNEKRAGDPFLRLTGVQLLCCALLAALLLGAFRLGGDLFYRLREEFEALNAADLDPGSFRFFDFGSGTEKGSAFAGVRDAPSSGAQETAPVESPDAAYRPGDGLSAGGADLTDEQAAREASFAFYTASQQVVMPVNGVASSPFGPRVHPVYGTEGFHSGKDIAAPEGTPVHAAMDGEVVAVGVGEKSGNYVKLRHADGVETLYCHLRAANVETGVCVRRGDVIGFVGQTGVATGPHLHFEVQINGVKRDPDRLLEGAVVVS